MQIFAESPDKYIEQLSDDRKLIMSKLRKTILDNLPKGFLETVEYGMITYVVPHSVYQAGYHCNPKTPLPFMSIASQKNFVAIYHMGIYANKDLMDWFVGEYPRHCKTRLDMGKSCIRFKKPDQIPFELIGQLTGKISVDDWIKIYESKFKH